LKQRTRKKTGSYALLKRNGLLPIESLNQLWVGWRDLYVLF